jgi:hypothetical protein
MRRNSNHSDSRSPDSPDRGGKAKHRSNSDEDSDPAFSKHKRYSDTRKKADYEDRGRGRSNRRSVDSRDQSVI